MSTAQAKRPPRDRTGLAEWAHIAPAYTVADHSFDVLFVDGTIGREVVVPLRPKSMSATRYRELYDSVPHTVEVWDPQHGYQVRYHVAGAVSAAVTAHSFDQPVVIYPRKAR